MLAHNEHCERAVAYAIAANRIPNSICPMADRIRSRASVEFWKVGKQSAKPINYGSQFANKPDSGGYGRKPATMRPTNGRVIKRGARV
jgi:hypothetical protein